MENNDKNVPALNVEALIEEMGVRKSKDKDGYEAWLKSEFVYVMAALLVDLFKAMDGENYVEMSIDHTELGPLVMTLQRKDGKTPHQLKKDAEDKLQKVLSQLQKVLSQK